MGEEDEERIARERREQRKAMLQQYETHPEPESAEESALVTENEPAKVEQAAQIVKANAPSKKETLTKPAEMSTEKEQKSLEVTKTDSSGPGLLRSDSANAGGVENSPNKWLNGEFKHNAEKGKYIKMIESMREKLQKEEEELRENAEENEQQQQQEEKPEEQGKPIKTSIDELTCTIAQEFDMFCETPEPLEKENVTAPTAV